MVYQEIKERLVLLVHKVHRVQMVFEESLEI